MADEKHAKGRLAEVKALAHFAAWGCEVAPVLGDNTSCDLVVLKDGRPFRVEVKSGQAPTGKRSNLAVTISSNTHRRSDGSLPNKAVDTRKFDLLAIYDPQADEVLVWRSGELGCKKTFTVTEERREQALKSGEDLVEGTGMAERRVGGLCLCGLCGSMHPDGFTLTPLVTFNDVPGGTD